MLRLLLIVALAIFVVFAALAVWAYQTWGFWGFVGALAAFVIFLWLLMKSIGAAFKRLFMMPFKMKGAVLKNAVVTVHSITPAAPPVIEADYDDMEEDDYDEDKARALTGPNGAEMQSDDEYDDDEEDDHEDYEDEEEPEDLDWYQIDVTITPQQTEGPFMLWEPGDLTLVRPDSKGGFEDDDGLGRIEGVMIWHDGQWHEDDASKYPGPQRVKLHAGVNRGARRAKLKYYFEVLEGELELPTLA